MDELGEDPVLSVFISFQFIEPRVPESANASRGSSRAVGCSWALFPKGFSSLEECCCLHFRLLY